MLNSKRYALLLALASIFSACSDAEAPTWPDGAELTLTVDDDAIVAEWPEASDNKGVTSYAVSVDGTPAAESGADARNFKAMNAPLGAPHEFSIVAKDHAGNQSSPLTATWAASDMAGPEWPVGKTLLVSRANPDAEPAKDGTLELEITWPAATDDGAVEFYRIVQVPTQLGGGVVRPKLIGLVKDGGTTIKANGLPSTKFQVYAIDENNNSSKPLSGALEDPTRLDPNRRIRTLDKTEKLGGSTPKVDKNEARTKMAQ